MYVIYVETFGEQRVRGRNIYDCESFYSRVGGMKQKIEDADTFLSFDDAQPTVKKLRSGLPDNYNAYAVRSILK